MIRTLGLIALGTILGGCNKTTDLPAQFEVDVESLDFGEVPLQSNDTLTFMISNPGGEDLDIFSVTLVAGDSGVWSVSRPDDDLLAGGENVTVEVTFSPDAEQVESGQIQVRTSVDSAFVRLSGSGAPSATDNDGDGVTAAEGDCDDSDNTRYPGAPELCDGRDNDCNGQVPANEADVDSDGFRLCDDDCNDDNANVYPGAPEICDNLDSDCNGTNPDVADGDGDGQTLCDGDCDDTNAAVNTSATEVCGDSLDNDCNSVVDDVDADGDGHSLCSQAGDCNDDPSSDGANQYPVVVDPSASGGGNGTDATPYNDLGTALSNLDGTCNEVFISGGSLTTTASVTTDVWIHGETDGSGAPLATLDGAAGGRVLTISGGAQVELEDLIITGGDTAGGATSGPDGGGIRIDGADLLATDVRFNANTATGDGGAIAINNGALDLVDCTFNGNTASSNGGAVAVSAGEFVDDGSVYANNQGDDGGAIYTASSPLTLQGVLLRGNTAGGAGGGVAVVGSDTLDIHGSEFYLNTASGAGGGLYLANINDADGTVRNNRLSYNDAGSTGGGIEVSGSSGTVSVIIGNNTIAGNDASGEGGAVHVGAADASGVVVWANAGQDNGGTSSVFTPTGTGADIDWNTFFRAGTVFAGDAALGTENVTGNPGLTTFSNGGNPDADDLSPGGTSSLLDSGPDDSAWNDVDTSRNDRGFTGGPGGQ